MNNWTVRQRIIITLGAIVALLVGLAGFSFYRLHSIQTQVESLEKDSVPGLHWINLLEVAVADYDSLLYRHIVASNATDIAEVDRQIDAKKLEIDSALVKYEPTAVDEK